MARFGRLKEKDIVNDPLHRWLVYLDKNSPPNLREEAIKMDAAIRRMQEKVDLILGDEAQLRTYLSYEKAASDEVSRINGARREGMQKGIQKAARNLKAMGLSIEQIVQGTGLTEDQVRNL